MVLTATIAMTAMTTTMTMKMHPFYPKPTNTQLIAYKPFLRTVPNQPRPIQPRTSWHRHGLIQPMASSMWADSADVVHRVPDLGSFPSDTLLNASLSGSVVDPA